MHMVLSIFVLVGCWYHIKLWLLTWGYKNCLYVAFTVWAFDRLARLGRILNNGVRRAEVTDLGGGYVGLDMLRDVARQAPLRLIPNARYIQAVGDFRYCRQRCCSSPLTTVSTLMGPHQSLRWIIWMWRSTQGLQNLSPKLRYRVAPAPPLVSRSSSRNRQV